MTENAIRQLLAVLILLWSGHLSFGQAADPHVQTAVIERARQALQDFESALGHLNNPYLSDVQMRDEASRRLRASLSPDARLENDLIPRLPKGRKVAASEYLRSASANYGKTGLALDFEWEEAEVKRSGNHYLVLLYGRKTILGSYQGRQRLHIENMPCRAGVFVEMDGTRVARTEIRFMDTNLTGKGKQTISLVNQPDPLQSITLPEITDQLAEQVLLTLGRQAQITLGIDEITFKGLGISGEFSKQLTGMLQSSLTRENSRIRIRNNASDSYDPVSKLAGSYELSGRKVRIHLLLKSPNNPSISQFNAELLAANIPTGEVEPSENLVIDALRIKAITGVRHNQPIATGSLQLDLTTNQGSFPQFYHEGDLMTVKIRANKPCTVRMLYQDAAKNLLQLRSTDFPIPAHMAGQWIELPERFLCAAPFGFETLLAYSTEGTFSPIEQKRSQDGFTFILDDLQKVAEQTLANENGGSIARAVIPITTYPRKPSR